MIKKDYIVLARVIKDNTRQLDNGMEVITKDVLLAALCRELLFDNPRFDFYKFRAACQRLATQEQE
mgnify:CR=1 FL=1